MPCDGGAVGEADADVVREVGVDRWEDRGVVRDRADAGEEVDGRLEGAGEDAGAVDVSRWSVTCSLWLGRQWTSGIAVMKLFGTHPVRNRLPILAPEKSNVDDGLSRLMISKAT